MSFDSFMQQFAPAVPEPAAPLVLDSTSSSLDAFIEKFDGVTESYRFYNDTVELRFQPEEHIYYLVGALGELTAQDGVTTICHIIDKSLALVPWSAKVCIAKLLRTIPTDTKIEATGPVPAHNFNKTTDACECGWKNDPTAIAHWEQQWGEHKRKSEVAPMMEIQIVPEMSLEAFTKLAMEAKSAHKDVLDDASNIGHIAHTWLEYYIKAILAGFTQEVESKLANLPKEERAANCVRAALAWMEVHSIKWIETERKIYSLKYGYAGTMDGLALVSSCSDPTCCVDTFKDRLSIIDWKSSNYLYIEYLYQTAAYESAYEEEFEVDVIDRWIIRLGKDEGEFETWHCGQDDFQEDIEGFLDALSLSRSVKMTTERMRDQKRVRRAVKKEVKAAAKIEEKAQRKQAREELKVERRAKKAEEKEAKKELKKAERAALKALISPGVAEAVIAEVELPSRVMEAEHPMVVFDTAAIELRIAAHMLLPEEKIETYVLPSLPAEG